MERVVQNRCLGMKKAMTLVAVVAVLLLSAGLAQAAWTNGKAATQVLGQLNFTANTPATTQNGLYGPIASCVDKNSGKVFVTDYVNNRVLRFSKANAGIDGANAEAVFGQTDYITNSSGRSATKLNLPIGCAITDSGDLWIADSVNGRALLYRDAANKPEFGASADLVLGQADFDSYSATTDQSTMAQSVYGVAIAPDGAALFVASAGQNRVLRWDNPGSLSNGAPANGVLGQPSFSTSLSSGGLGSAADLPTPTRSSLGYPTAVALDEDGALYVSDLNNRRVLRFEAAAYKAIGADADGVLGVTDYTTIGVGACTRITFGLVYSLLVPRDGRLYVGDYEHNRILVFDAPASKANGAGADYVLGQTDFLSNASGNTATNLAGPMGLGHNPLTGHLYVGDFGNNRVLGYHNYDLRVSPPVPALPSVGLALFAGLLMLAGLVWAARTRA